MNVNMNRIETLEELIESYKKCPYKVETYEFDGTGYALLIIEINKMLKENKKYKEVIDKAIYLLDNYQNNLYSKKVRETLDDDIEIALKILKEVE